MNDVQSKNRALPAKEVSFPAFFLINESVLTKCLFFSEKIAYAQQLLV